MESGEESKMLTQPIEAAQKQKEIGGFNGQERGSGEARQAKENLSG